MPGDFEAILSQSSSRVDDWLKVFGTTIIPLRSPLPTIAILPGLGERVIYQIDISALSPEQRQRMIQHISRRFRIAPEEVDAALDEQGCPIRAEDVTVSIHNPQKWIR